MTAAALKCNQCGRRSTEKTLEKYDGLCPRCNAVKHLPAFDDARAEAIVHDIRRRITPNNQLSELKKRIQPPPFARQWAAPFEWHTLDIHDYATRHWEAIGIR